MELTLNGGWFRELEYRYNGSVWAIVWHPNKAINIGGKVDLCRLSVREDLLYKKRQFAIHFFP